MFLQGVFLGLSLSFMIGPLFFSIIQASLEQGFRAGMAVALGIWLSDVLYVYVILAAMGWLTALTAIPDFKFWAGMAGGTILLVLGLGTLMVHRKGNHLEWKPVKKRSYLGWGLRGFFINTINPFTVFFWLGIGSAVIVPEGWSKGETFIFFSGMLGTLVLTDTLKAFGAKQLQQVLSSHHIHIAKMGIGWLLLIFGIVLVFRSM